MPSPTRARGDRGESIAVAHLASLRWRIVARNVLFRVGELDIVAEDPTSLVFVEVRSLWRGEGTAAANTVTLPKQRRLTRAAGLFMASYRGHRATGRFDIVGVDLQQGRVVDHIRGAFDATEF